MTAFRSLRVIFALCLLTPAGCLAKHSPSAATRGAGAIQAAPPAAAPPAKSGPTLKAAQESLRARKLVKNATVRLVVASPSATARRAEAIVERAGGYLASSENTSATSEETDVAESVRVVLKVPADQLTSALAEIEKLAPGVQSEQLTTEDVTDHYVDLSARLKSQLALEAQYLQILKQANRVQDALDVQKQLASVRSEIEKLQGQKRVLDQQIALSTITLSLSKRAALISANAAHFGRSLKSAGADAINLGVAVITGGIRLMGVLIPLVLLVFLPLSVGFRWAIRRARRMKASTA